jgi:GAF domain-containing protein
MTAMLDDEVADLRRINAELQQRLDERTAELQVRTAERDDSEAQKAAMAEIVEAINASPGDLAPVFDAILGRAMRLCQAACGGLSTYDGLTMKMGASRGYPGEALEAFREFVPPVGAMSFEIVQGASVVHVADVSDSEAYRSGVSSVVTMVDTTGIKTGLWIALRKDDDLLGMINLYRAEIRPFTEKQISLLQNFAAQAVIAMENARLLTETRQALEKQTATAEILRVISGSPTDLQPTFDAIVENATILSGAEAGGVFRFDGSLIHFVAQHGYPPNVLEAIQRDFPTRPGRHSTTARAILTREVAHIPDAAADPEYSLRAILQTGVHTMLSVPILQDGNPVGAITVTRLEVAPFSQAQIDLLKTFADQAVIAIENVRLFNETQEALEQQTATAEVLQVINSSPGDLTPVFDAMLEKAMRLCEASFGHLTRVDGELFYTIAERGAPPPLVEFLRQPRRIMPENAHSRLRGGEDFVHLEDIISDDVYRSGNSSGQALGDLGGARTALWVALRKDDTLLGAFVIYRREVRPFSDKQIALLQNFAAQAVIAIENARLLTETREALEQQTATAEVLQVINSSPGDIAPVFDTILEKARLQCDAIHGDLWTYDGECLHLVATHGEPGFSEWLRQQAPLRPWPGSPPERVVLGQDFVHVDDALADASYQLAPEFLEQVKIAGIRTTLLIGLRKEGRLLGLIVVYRRVVQAFSDQQIALLQNFAAQAVIAMENARLLTETREALEQQTATAEVLQVINSSPGDLGPVFDAMLEKAIHLCGADHGHVFTYDGELFRGVAARGDPWFIEWLRERGSFPPSRGITHLRLVQGARLVHLADLRQDEVYRSTEPSRQAAFDRSGIRSLVTVALRKDEVLLGGISVYRKEVRPFTDQQIALLQNFASQAVIAMENARLITETREALEQQTATAEVLQVIHSSPGNLAPVFDAMLERAMRLCEAAFGFLSKVDGERTQSRRAA